MSSNHIVCVWTPSWLAATFFTLCLDGENSSADGRDITPMQLLTGWEDLQRTHTPRRCGCVHADTQFPSVRCLFYHKCSASTEMDFPSEACKVWLPLASRYCSFKAPTCNMFVCLFVCSPSCPRSWQPCHIFGEACLLAGFDGQRGALHPWAGEPRTDDFQHIFQTFQTVWSIFTKPIHQRCPLTQPRRRRCG